MRSVMTRVPGVKRESGVERPIARFRMAKCLFEIVGRHGIQKCCPASMNPINDPERNVDRKFTVSEFCPAVFVIRHDRRRFVFSQCELEPHVRIDMTISDVMYRLPYGPPAGTVWRVELFFA